MFSLNRLAGFLLAASVIFAVGCESPEKNNADADIDWDRPVIGKALELVTDPAQYPDFREMFKDKDSSIRAIDQSLIWFSKPSSKFHYPYHDYPAITHERAVQSLLGLKEALNTASSPDEFATLMSSNYEVYRSVGHDSKSGRVMFTGYYTPIFQGSRTETPEFKFPLYKLPADLVKDFDGMPRGRKTPDGQIVPYYTRSEIDGQGILKGQEICWLRTRLDAYIIHVQGSAQIDLPTGEKLYLGYAGKTDRPYKGLGVTMVEDGKISKKELSLMKIREYFAAHPDDADRYMNMNESYVFFKESDPGGPYGSIGVAVTPNRTIATDKDLFPWGAPGAVATLLPNQQTLTPEPFVSLICDQDRGGAIRSAGRCDIYVGVGPNAERIAGHTYNEGKLYYFFTKTDSKLGQGAKP